MPAPGPAEIVRDRVDVLALASRLKRIRSDGGQSRYVDLRESECVARRIQTQDPDLPETGRGNEVARERLSLACRCVIRRRIVDRGTAAEIAGPLRVRWNRLIQRSRPACPEPLVVAHEECLVAPDRPAHDRPEL